MAEIYHMVSIKAHRRTVYESIITQKGLSQWWLPDTIAKAEVGFINEMGIRDLFTNKMKVIDLQPDRRVEWECINDTEGDEWTGTHVVFDLVENDGNTNLHFRHSGWKEQSEFFGICNFHWARHLMMLKHLCETGVSLLHAENEKLLAEIAMNDH